MADVWFEGMSLPVSDLARSIGFYESLGFTLEIRADRFALLRLGAGTVGLLEVGPRAARNPMDGDTRLRSLVQVELSTDDLDALHRELLAGGIAVHTPPRDRGFERQMQLRDPDGYTVEYAEGVRGHNATR